MLKRKTNPIWKYVLYEKYLLALAALALLSVSCGKEEETPSTPSTPSTPDTPATVAVTSVTVAPTTLTLEVGTIGALSATIAPDNATVKTVTWASNNTAGLHRCGSKAVERYTNMEIRDDFALRTFAGNIYRQVKDPNLVASLTGHAEGSRAFNRYREIDLGMKQDLVKILENKKG